MAVNNDVPGDSNSSCPQTSTEGGDNIDNGCACSTGSNGGKNNWKNLLFIFIIILAVAVAGHSILTKNRSCPKASSSGPDMYKTSKTCAVNNPSKDSTICPGSPLAQPSVEWPIGKDSIKLLTACPNSPAADTGEK